MATRTLALPVNPSDAFADAMRRMKRDDEFVTRPARRTLAEMAPGYQRQPLLRLVPAKATNNERCLFCDGWLCDGVSCQRFAPTAVRTALKEVA
ncbi:hypothetical protein [Streptomyces lateritius]|uniref:hypothetical protein n=1 Tax=Streptomyces lateritius TaxID=67313 RepID=UPI0016761FA3|nr:hypothetical protein [Streptomyces lateritius]